MRVLFTGYAPVHFACFRPLFERLDRTPDVDVFLSGGLRERTDDGYVYDELAMYEPFGVARDRILTMEEMRRQAFDVLFASNTNMIEPRSVRTRIQIFHGISFRNKAVRSANMGCDHYFVVGPYMKRRFVEGGLMTPDDQRAVPIGFMKTDRLLDGSLSRAEELARHGLDGSRPVLLYAPTGQRHNSLETMGEEVIEHLTRSGTYDLLIKPHDHPKNREIDWFARLARFESAHCRVVRDPDVVPLLFAADLLISDASSVTNEFALLERPLIYLDVPKLLSKAKAADGSMLDLDTWGRRGGEIVRDPADVERVVDAALLDSDAHVLDRRAMVRDLFYNPGNATNAAIEWLEHHRCRIQDRSPMTAS